MKLKSRHWIELGVVIVLLAVLLTIFVPHFLEIQKSEIGKSIFHDLSALLAALQKYSADYPGISNPTGLRDQVILHLGKKRNGMEIYKGGSYGNNEVNHLANVFILAQFLEEAGYLENSGSFQYYRSQNPDASIHYISQKGTNDEARAHFIGLAALWPYTDPEILQTKLANAHRNFDRVKFIESYIPNQPYRALLKQDYRFSLTNGVTSFGYVYCDTLGNRSYSGN